MKKIETTKDLKQSIRFLEIRQAQQLKVLKIQLQETYVNITPAHFFEDVIHESGVATSLKDELINTSVGMATGYITKKVTFGNSSNPLKQFVGGILQTGVSNLVSNHVGELKAIIQLITSPFTKKHSS